MIRARIAAEELGPLATIVLRETSQAVDWTAAMAAGARVLGHVSTYAEDADGTRVALDEASVDAAVDAWTRKVNVTGFLFDVDPGTDNETSVLEAYLDHARTALAAGAANVTAPHFAVRPTELANAGAVAGIDDELVVVTHWGPQAGLEALTLPSWATGLPSWRFAGVVYDSSEWACSMDDLRARGVFWVYATAEDAQLARLDDDWADERTVVERNLDTVAPCADSAPARTAASLLAGAVLLLCML